jgi:hypothetical protein
MGNLVINDGLGRLAEKCDDGADLIVVPLSAMEADATVKDGYSGPPTTLANFLGSAGNTEQTGSSWARKTHVNANITVTIDDSGDKVVVILDNDDTWSAVAAANNTTDIVISEDGASDTVRYPITCHDFAVTTDGNDVTAEYHDTNGIWQSS